MDYRKIYLKVLKDIKKFHIPGMAIIVVNKNDIIFKKKYGNCLNYNTPFIIGSMSKSFTALAIMQLVERGKLNLNDKISKYVDISKWFIDKNNIDKITIKNLLNHTSGITTYQTFGKLKITKLYGKYVYSNANYGLLGIIIENITKKTYEEYINENIFIPLNMNYSAASLEKSKKNGLINGYKNYFGIPIVSNVKYPFDIKQNTWTNVPAGYISSSILDIGKYLQMYLNCGKNIVNKNSINSMFYDNVEFEKDSYYGMGWFYSEKNFNNKMLWHAGLVENYISNMFIMPDKEIAVAILVNMNDYFVTNNFIDNIINPFIEEKRKNISNLYFGLHLIINLLYLMLFLLSFYIIFYNKLFIINIIGHLIIPVILLSLPLIIKVPIKVIKLFVTDFYLVWLINILLLVVSGVYKLFII